MAAAHHRRSKRASLGWRAVNSKKSVARCLFAKGRTCLVGVCAYAYYAYSTCESVEGSAVWGWRPAAWHQLTPHAACTLSAGLTNTIRPPHTADSGQPFAFASERTLPSGRAGIFYARSLTRRTRVYATVPGARLAHMRQCLLIPHMKRFSCVIRMPLRTMRSTSYPPHAEARLL